MQNQLRGYSNRKGREGTWTVTMRLERKEETMEARPGGVGRVVAGTEGSGVSSKVTRSWA